MKEFNREELAAADGQGGKPACIAYEGRVFDVTSSKLWKKGRHMQRHTAGRDLTDELAAAPHGPDVLTRFPRAGSLGKAAAVTERLLPPWLSAILARFPMLERHPHPMAVHFPIAFLLAVPLFDLLCLATGDRAFATTARHCLAAGIVTLPLGMATGFFTWWLNYLAKPTLTLGLKIILTALLLILSVGILIWKSRDPGAPAAHTASGLFHLVLVLCFVPLVSIIGWLGGSLTFPTGRSPQQKTHR